MFTVLIAEKEHIDAIQQQNKLFFGPFLENKELAFCQWNPEGQSLTDSVPGLIDAVGRQKKWRAVIINHCKGELLKSQNPFDIVDCSKVASLSMPEKQPESESLWDIWESSWKAYYEALAKEKEEMYRSALTHPLQKLCTWLCYKPEGFVLNEVQDKQQDVHEWAMEQISKDFQRPNVTLELLEREQYKHELRLKEVIRKEFVADKYLNIAYPTEVHCITQRTSDTNFFNPENFWNIRSDHDYSTFADRNMYFDKMRFMVFDLLASTHRDFRTDYIRFLASVLIFASNPLPASVMQPRYLYQLETDTDDTPLCTLVTSYDKKLAATAEVIDNEMEKIRSEIPGNLTDKDVEAIISTTKDIDVILDESCDPKKVYAETDYGLFFDSPENEFHKWNRNYNNSQSALAYIVKQQSRAIKKSVVQAQLSSEILDIDVSRLTPLQVDDIKDYTDVVENNMIDSIPPDLNDISRYTEILEKRSKNVKKAIRRRMTRKTTLSLSAIFLGLLLICFLPFLFSNTHTPRTVTTAVILTGAMLGALAAIMYIALFCLRSTIKKAVNAYNYASKTIINDIFSSLDRFSRYLSASCNVRRGHLVQFRANQNLDEYTKSLRIRQKHKEDIRKKRALLKEQYRDYFGDKTFCDETMSRPYEYDFGQKTEYVYTAPYLAGDTRQIEFMSSGNFVSVPSSYIKQISVKMEEIYEK